MEKIKLRVLGNQIAVAERPVITAGTVGLVTEFTFDSQWESLTKTAVFKAGDKVVSATLEGNSHTVPWEVLAKPNLWLNIGVYGANADGTVVIPTLWAPVAVVHTGTDPEGDPALEPTAPLWQNLLSRVEEIGDVLHNVDTVSVDNKTAIDNHISNWEGDNPHGVTCGQIGAATMDALTEVGTAVTVMESVVYDNKAAIENHVNNTGGDNPHGVTAAQVGAAPSGYGLGEKASLVDNWNAGYANAFARSNSNSPDGKMWYGIVCRDAANAATTTEIAFSAEAGNSVCEVRRSRNAAGTWGQWEYVNPPMLPGVEYRTTERWMGKPVYTMLMDCGEAVDNQNVDLGDQYGIIRVEGCILNEEGTLVCPLPNGQIAWLDTRADIGIITFRCNESSYCGEGRTVYIRLWYVK